MAPNKTTISILDIAIGFMLGLVFGFAMLKSGLFEEWITVGFTAFSGMLVFLCITYMVKNNCSNSTIANSRAIAETNAAKADDNTKVDGVEPVTEPFSEAFAEFLVAYYSRHPAPKGVSLRFWLVDEAKYLDKEQLLRVAGQDDVRILPWQFNGKMVAVAAFETE